MKATVGSDRRAERAHDSLSRTGPSFHREAAQLPQKRRNRLSDRTWNGRSTPARVPEATLSRTGIVRREGPMTAPEGPDKGLVELHELFGKLRQTIPAAARRELAFQVV